MRDAFQYMLQDNQEKCDKQDLKSITQKIEKLEKAINSLALDNGRLKEKFSIERLEFNINR